MTTEYAEQTKFPDLKNPFRIQLSLDLPHDPIFDHFLSAAQSTIETMIPSSFWQEMESEPNEDARRSSFFRLSRKIPLINYTAYESGEGSIIVRMLCQSEFTQGASRFVSDTFSGWLVPGKHLDYDNCIGIHFAFELCPKKSFFFMQEVFRFSHPHDLSIALSNIHSLVEEIRLAILAVYHARYIGSMKILSSEQRTMIIQENLSNLVSSFPNPERSAYDQMHQFILKLSEEEKIDQVKKNINQLMSSRPTIFERDIFYEMNSFTSNFSNQFSTIRDSRHISRIIAFHYLFKKTLLLATLNAPSERHVRFKLMKGQLSGSDPVIGILVGLNLLSETERFDNKHLMRAIQSCLPSAKAVADSFVMDRREEKIRIFYLEIKRDGQQPFSHHEIRALHHELPSQIKGQVENIVHPIFMPRNEEEVLKNIVLLAKQIKFLRDIPHLTIQYEKQSDSEISFLIVMVRLLKENDLPFKELIKTSESDLRITIDEIRSAGSLKGRYPKEAVIFRATLGKALFLRNDYSLDLKRARQKVSSSLRQILGDYRDYNGGMIHKQNEALEQLRKLIGPAISNNEVLLENYFYSLRPGIMQTVHPPEALKILFDLLLEALREDIFSKKFSLKVAQNGKYFFAMIAAATPLFKDEVLGAIAKLKIPSYDLTTTFLLLQEKTAFGIILRADEPERRSELEQILHDVIKKPK